MAAPVRLRGDISSAQVRAFARRAKDGDQVRRLLAIATILDGGSRSDAAKAGGVTLQIVRDWVLRFNAQGPDGLETRKVQAPIPSSTTVECVGQLYIGQFVLDRPKYGSEHRQWWPGRLALGSGIEWIQQLRDLVPVDRYRRLER